jgi:two-component system, NtrC family, sensor histidine kinase KinB
MRTKRLQTRFILAGALLVLTTVGSSLWSAWTFARLSAVVDTALRDSQKTIDLTAALAGTLEREDDALLLAVSGNRDAAGQQLTDERKRAEALFRQLDFAIKDDEIAERSLAARLRQEMDSYRDAGSKLIVDAREPTALQRYHERVNPLLRQAVATCAKIREANFKEMQDAGIQARDKARRATLVVIAVSVMAVLLASVVAFWLARSILLPVRELTASVEAMRQGNFERQVRTASRDELGQLAAGFNRMAESLAEYRRSSLGELLAAKATLEATINALPDAVFVIAPDGQVVAINPPGKAVLEAKKTPQAVRLPDLPLLPEHRDAVTMALAGQRNSGARTDFTHTLPVMLTGRPHRLLVTAVPITDFLPGRTGAVVVLDDVTEFARLDELRSELIGIASHELKTPLTTLRMNLLLLGENAANLTSRQHEILAAAATACEELDNTIDELLDVTRIEAGQLRLDLAVVDLRVVVNQVLLRLQPRFTDSQVAVQVSHDSSTPCVRADANRLRTVLTNLLTNALKYSPTGGAVTIRMVSRQNAAALQDSVLQVAVTDQGPGVPAEFRERVFEKFFRVEDQRGGNPKGVRGSGIGLYLCREIVKAHGGSVRCETGDGGSGTRIAFTLPRTAA